MTRKKTQSEFVSEVFELVGNEYEVLSLYEGNKNKVTFRHNECGNEFEMSPIKFINSGQRCPLHRSERISSAKTKDKLEFKKEFKLKRPELKLLSDYKGVSNKIKVSGSCGHVWEANAKNLLNGSGCPSCKGVTGTEDFIFRMIEKYGTEFEVLGDYKNNQTSIEVKHNHCGNIFSASPKSLMSKGNCPKCMQSNGEAVVDRWLYNEGFEYEAQFKIKDCKNVHPLPFDFMTTDKEGNMVLIEVDGAQHFKKSNFWGKGDEQWEKIQKNDKIKNHYCENNGIKLLRLPYWWFRNERYSNELNKALKLIEGSTTRA